MASSRADLLRRQRRWADTRGIRYDARGYVRELADNLGEPLSAAALAELARGSELDATPSRPPRLYSLTSSAALVVNVFGHWRERDKAPLLRALGLDAEDGARLGFEEPLPTGLPGEPPLADVALRFPSGRLVAIESKFGESLVRRPRNQRVLKDKYFPRGAGEWSAAGLPRCQALAEDLQSGRERLKFVHAAQILKHVLGLARSGAPRWTLIYLYFDWPRPEAATHRAELARVLERIGHEADVSTVTYQALWDSLRSSASVEPDYSSYLAARYFG